MSAFRLLDKQWDELDRLRFSAGDAKVFRNCLIILMSDCGVRPLAAVDRPRVGMQPGHCRLGSQTVSPARDCRADAAEIAGTHAAGHARVPGRTAKGGANASPALRIWLQRLVGGATGCAPQEDNGPVVQRRACAADCCARKDFPSSPKHTMKGKRDEAAYEKAQQRLKRLKKGRFEKLAKLS